MMRLHLCDECLEALIAPDVMYEELSISPPWYTLCANAKCENEATSTVTRIGESAKDYCECDRANATTARLVDDGVHIVCGKPVRPASQVVG